MKTETILIFHIIIFDLDSNFLDYVKIYKNVQSFQEIVFRSHVIMITIFLVFCTSNEVKSPLIDNSLSKSPSLGIIDPEKNSSVEQVIVGTSNVIISNVSIENIATSVPISVPLNTPEEEKPNLTDFMTPVPTFQVTQTVEMEPSISTILRTEEPSFSMTPTPAPKIVQSPEISQIPLPDVKNVSNIFCNKQNTLKTIDGDCVCQNGYQSTDPANLGCWKCSVGCDFNSECVFPGKCQCKKGYEGNGVICRVPAPILESIEPTECLSFERCQINATIKIPEDVIITTIYCRIEDVILDAQLIKPNYISCRSPHFPASVAQFKVSFDAKFWSNPLPIKFLSNKATQIGWLFPLALTIVALFIVFSLVFLLRGSDKNEINEELLPFSKGTEGRKRRGAI